MPNSKVGTDDTETSKVLSHMADTVGESGPALPLPDSQSAQALAQLETRLQNEQDGRREDRFIFVVVLVVIFDAWIFIQMDNWMGPLILGILELLGLILFARRCGIEEIDRLVDKALALFKKS